MSLTRRSPSGFSLTEILMAVGILGIGMTMVASIFPVAVDQTRRANDSTMAALCARSVAATMRANRTSFVNGHRKLFRELMADGTRANDRERPAEFGVAADSSGAAPVGNPGIAQVTANGIIARNLRVYNPNLFLYEAGRRYETEKPTAADSFWPMWNAGNYVPVLYVTPIVPHDKRVLSGTTDLYNHDGGPFRVTIVVFKSRGAIIESPLYADGDKLHPRLKTWKENAVNTVAGQPTFVAGGGNYIIDRGKHSGEAYLIDFTLNDPARSVTLGTSTLTGNAATPPAIFLACGTPAESRGSTPSNMYAPIAITYGSATTATHAWYPLPGAVAVFHTIIGD